MNRTGSSSGGIELAANSFLYLKMGSLIVLCQVANRFPGFVALSDNLR